MTSLADLRAAATTLHNTLAGDSGDAEHDAAVDLVQTLWEYLGEQPTTWTVMTPRTDDPAWTRCIEQHTEAYDPDADPGDSPGWRTRRVAELISDLAHTGWIAPPAAYPDTTFFASSEDGDDAVDLYASFPSTAGTLTLLIGAPDDDEFKNSDAEHPDDALEAVLESLAARLSAATETLANFTR